jgi:hypothetical protein
MTTARPLRTVATSELVVPRSMPTASRAGAGRRLAGFCNLQKCHEESKILGWLLVVVGALIFS